MYIGKLQPAGMRLISNRAVQYWSPSVPPPPPAGLGGFFDDVARFGKKAVRYTGSAVIGTFMTAGQRQKAFGLSTRESSQFEIGAKVTRGVLAAVATAGLAYKVHGAVAAAKAASAAKAAGSGGAVLGGKLSLAGAGQLAPGVAGTAPAFGSGAVATSASVAGGSALPTFYGGVKAAAVAAAKPVGLLGTLGKGVGQIALLGAVMKRGGVSVLGDFGSGYRDVTGEALPPIPIGDIIGQAIEAGREIRQNMTPAPAEAYYGSVPAAPGEYIEAGVSPLLLVAGAAVVLGGGVLLLGKKK